MPSFTQVKIRPTRTGEIVLTSSLGSILQNNPFPLEAKVIIKDSVDIPTSQTMGYNIVLTATEVGSGATRHLRKNDSDPWTDSIEFETQGLYDGTNFGFLESIYVEGWLGDSVSICATVRYMEGCIELPIVVETVTIWGFVHKITCSIRNENLKGIEILGFPAALNPGGVFTDNSNIDYNNINKPNFKGIVPIGWSGTLTPNYSKPQDYEWAPSSRTYSNLEESLCGQNFDLMNYVIISIELYQEYSTNVASGEFFHGGGWYPQYYPPLTQAYFEEIIHTLIYPTYAASRTGDGIQKAVGYVRFSDPNHLLLLPVKLAEWTGCVGVAGYVRNDTKSAYFSKLVSGGLEFKGRIRNHRTGEDLLVLPEYCDDWSIPLNTTVNVSTKRSTTLYLANPYHVVTPLPNYAHPSSGSFKLTKENYSIVSAGSADDWSEAEMKEYGWQVMEYVYYFEETNWGSAQGYSQYLDIELALNL